MFTIKSLKLLPVAPRAWLVAAAATVAMVLLASSIEAQQGPEVTVQFGESEYAVAEGASTVIAVTLSADPERQVVVPINATAGDGTDEEDYSGIPDSVTFESGETSTTFSVEAASDGEDDEGETVGLEFGTLPDRVTAGDTSSSTVTISSTPGFVSANASANGIEVRVEFTEDVAAAPFVAALADSFRTTEATILKYLFRVRIDEVENHLMTASISEEVVTIRLESPGVREDQTVEVSYNNIFTTEPGGALTDNDGNAAPTFGWQDVTNNVDGEDTRGFVDPPVPSGDEFQVCEGQSGTYGLKLASQPEGNVTISPFAYPYGVLLAQPPALNFTPENWDEQQEVRYLAEDLRYFNLPEEIMSFWGITYHHMSGVSSDTTFESPVRVLVRRSEHPECSAEQTGGL